MHTMPDRHNGVQERRQVSLTGASWSGSIAAGLNTIETRRIEHGRLSCVVFKTRAWRSVGPRLVQDFVESLSS